MANQPPMDTKSFRKGLQDVSWTAKNLPILCLWGEGKKLISNPCCDGSLSARFTHPAQDGPLAREISTWGLLWLLHLLHCFLPWASLPSATVPQPPPHSTFALMLEGKTSHTSFWHLAVSWSEVRGKLSFIVSKSFSGFVTILCFPWGEPRPSRDKQDSWRQFLQAIKAESPVFNLCFISPIFLVSQHKRNGTAPSWSSGGISYHCPFLDRNPRRLNLGLSLQL